MPYTKEIVIQVILLQQLLPGRCHCQQLVCNDTKDRGGCTVARNTQGEKRKYDEKIKRKKMLSMQVRIADPHSKIVKLVLDFQIGMLSHQFWNVL